MVTPRSTATWPSSGCSWPVIIRNSVVLPAPLGPTRPTFSPFWSAAEASMKSIWWPFCLLMLSRRIMCTRAWNSCGRSYAMWRACGRVLRNAKPLVLLHARGRNLHARECGLLIPLEPEVESISIRPDQTAFNHRIDGDVTDPDLFHFRFPELPGEPRR